MRRAIIAHLFYPELSLDLVGRIAAVDSDVDVLASGPALNHEPVAEALARLPHRVRRLSAADRGFDVGPFLRALRLVQEDGYDIFAKLHTKRGDPAHGGRWRKALLDGTIGAGLPEAATARFAADSALAIVGAGPLYLSAVRNMLANAATVAELGAICFPDRDLPGDWGFFAGTMFWGRVAAFEPFLNLERRGYVMPANLGLADGHPAHALERLFGLAGKAALVDIDRDGGQPVLHDAPQPLAPTTIMEVLPSLGRPDPDAPINAAEARRAAADNPLLHYLLGGTADIDPHPHFNEGLYRQMGGVAGAALVAFLRKGIGADWPELPPDLQDHVYRHPWLRRIGVNPLVDRIRRIEDPADAFRRKGEPDSEEQPTFLIRTGADPVAASYWGDVPFAEGLATALRRGGSRVAVEHRAAAGGIADVVVVLRGPAALEPRDGATNILWIISHPDQVTPDELDRFDLVYVASDTAHQLLGPMTRTPVLPLLQATDAARFRPPRMLTDGGEVLFVGNTRGEDRQVVRWAVEEGLRPAVYGFGWDKLLPRDLIRGARVDDRSLPARYASAAAVLNDHWAAMGEFGIVSNRLFDTLASGGNPVSDAAPAVSRLGRSVTQVAGRSGVADAVRAAAKRSPAERRADAERVRRDHSFDARARTMLGDVELLRSGRAPFRPAVRRRGRTVVILLPRDEPVPGDLIHARLIAPLTREEAGPITLHIARLGDPPAAQRGDAVMVQTSGFCEATDAEAAIAYARDAGARLIVDDAGAPGAGPPLLLASADEAWFASEALMKMRGLSGRDAVMPDALDQRLWRDFHRRSVFDWSGRPVRILMLGTRHLRALVDAIRSAGLAEAVAVVAIGDGQQDIDAPFVTVRDRPAKDRTYPRFAHWLRAMPQPHVAVALDAAEADRAFLVHSALGALSILPGAPQDAAIERDCLALVADEAALPGLLRSVVAEPLRFAGLAAAASRHVWSERSAGSLAATMRGRLKASGG